MRTTVILPDELYAQVKRAARDADQTVTAVMDEALRRELARRAQVLSQPDVVFPEPFDPGPGGGVRPGIDLMSNSSVLDAMNEGLPIEKMR